MLSPADLFVAFVGGLLLFGPEGLPQVARKAGKIMREVRSTSESFVREMERAADVQEARIGGPPEAGATAAHLAAPAEEAPLKSSGSSESH